MERLTIPVDVHQAIAQLFPALRDPTVLSQLEQQFDPAGFFDLVRKNRKRILPAVSDDDDDDDGGSSVAPRSRRRIERFLCDALGQDIVLDDSMKELLLQFFVSVDDAPADLERKYDTVEIEARDPPVHKHDNVFETLGVRTSHPVSSSSSPQSPSSPSSSPPSPPSPSPLSSSLRSNDRGESQPSLISTVNTSTSAPMEDDERDDVSVASSADNWQLMYPRGRRPALSTEESSEDDPAQMPDEQLVSTSLQCRTAASELQDANEDLTKDTLEERIAGVELSDGDDAMVDDGEVTSSDEYREEDDGNDDHEIEDDELDVEVDAESLPSVPDDDDKDDGDSAWESSTDEADGKDAEHVLPKRERAPRRHRVPKIAEVPIERKPCSFSVLTALFVYLLIVGQPQGGKSYSMAVIACAMRQKKRPAKRIIVLHAHDNQAWKEETIKDFVSRGFVDRTSWDGECYTRLCPSVHIWHKGDLQAARDLPKAFFHDAVVFWDEVQSGSRKDGLLSECFTNWGLRNFEQMKGNNTVLVGFSATPDDIAVCFSEMPREHAKIFILPVNEQRYYGIRKMIESGNLQDSHQLVHYKEDSKKRVIDGERTRQALRIYVAGLVKLLEQRQDETRSTAQADQRYWHLLRPESHETRDEDDVKAKMLIVRYIREELQRLGVADTWHVDRHDYRNKDRERSLVEMPHKHTILVITHFYGKANRIKEEYLLSVYEYSAGRHDDFIVQSLMGRCCGWDKKGLTKVFSKVDAALRYLCWAERGFSLGAVPYTGAHFRSTPNGGIAFLSVNKKDSIECNACIDELDREELTSEQRETILQKRTPALEAEKVWVKLHAAPRATPKPRRLRATALTGHVVIKSMDLYDELLFKHDIIDGTALHWSIIKDTVMDTIRDRALRLPNKNGSRKPYEPVSIQEQLDRNLLKEAFDHLLSVTGAAPSTPEERDKLIRQKNCFMMRVHPDDEPRMVFVLGNDELPNPAYVDHDHPEKKLSLVVWDEIANTHKPIKNLSSMPNGEVKIFIGHDHRRNFDPNDPEVPHTAGYGNRAPALFFVFRVSKDNGNCDEQAC